jgi:Asparaginase, N-terminal
VPELSSIANLDLKVAFNLDSSRIGPSDWIALAKLLDANRRQYDAFLVVHGEFSASGVLAISVQLREHIKLQASLTVSSSVFRYRYHGIYSSRLELHAGRVQEAHRTHRCVTTSHRQSLCIAFWRSLIAGSCGAARVSAAAAAAEVRCSSGAQPSSSGVQMQRMHGACGTNDRRAAIKLLHCHRRTWWTASLSQWTRPRTTGFQKSPFALAASCCAATGHRR